jgi:hypothetical protein
MRHHSEFLMMGIVIFVILLFFQSASAQYAIPRSVFGSGGASLSSSANRLVGTLGQPFIGTMSGAFHRHTAGFWPVQRALVTDVAEKPEETLPMVYRLDQNYPNPFNPSTKIKFQIPARLQESHEAGGPNLKPQTVSLKVYDILGREVRTLVNDNLQPGSYEVTFDATGLASGVYFYRLQSGEFTQTKRMVLMR